MGNDVGGEEGRCDADGGFFSENVVCIVYRNADAVHSEIFYRSP